MIAMASAVSAAAMPIAKRVKKNPSNATELPGILYRHHLLDILYQLPFTHFVTQSKTL
jgi:hypothetical protein